ncbi:MAG: 3-deoxy-D-manno-octulosonic acid transferase [Planctomycetales bacterium]|nr:3-deoxy-D-manno-octulosonic acid transferase [Planctomycetales bacterium]
MRYVLNFVYLTLLAVASPWLLWAAFRKGKYREGFAEKLLGRAPVREGDRPCVWLHAVSVGEVNLLAVLIAEIERRRPDVECVISTTTHTGYQLAKKKHPAHTVFYCPLDFSWAVEQAMRAVRPDVLALAELELWPNLIAAARRSGARVAVVNGRLGEKSFRGYSRIRPLVRRVLRQIDLIAVQSEAGAERFAALCQTSAPAQQNAPAQESRPTICVTGSLKFDGASADRDNPQTARLARLAGIDSSDVVFLAGSTQDPEEALALAAYQSCAAEFPQLRLIVVPRHPDRFDKVAALLDESGVAWARRSQLREGEPPAKARVLLVDTIGELGHWWGAADVAYVGGSMGSRGGQNMIEPAAYGAAVSFGPCTWNFREVVALLASGDAAAVVHSGAEMTDFLRECLKRPELRHELGDRARRLVAQQQGAVARTIDALAPLLPPAAENAALRAA